MVSTIHWFISNWNLSRKNALSAGQMGKSKSLVEFENGFCEDSSGQFGSEWTTKI